MKQRIELIFVFTYLFIHSLSASFFFLFPVSALRFVTATAGQTKILPPPPPLLFSVFFWSFFFLCNLFSYFPPLFEHLDILTSFWFGRQDFSKAACGRVWSAWWSQRWIKLMRICAHICVRTTCLGCETFTADSCTHHGQTLLQIFLHVRTRRAWVKATCPVPPPKKKSSSW